jgi:hypothetical protein
MKSKLDLERLEDRSLPTAATNPAATLAPAHPGPQTAVVAPAAPGGSAGADGHLAVVVGGIRVNHNQTLVRVRRRRIKAR